MNKYVLTGQHGRISTQHRPGPEGRFWRGLAAGLLCVGLLYLLVIAVFLL